jgi:hypothetical protein
MDGVAHAAAAVAKYRFGNIPAWDGDLLAALQIGDAALGDCLVDSFLDLLFIPA